MKQELLHCIVVDDDPKIFTDIKGFLYDSRKAIVTNCFETCTEFLAKMNDIPFDIVFLDLMFLNDVIGGVEAIGCRADVQTGVQDVDTGNRQRRRVRFIEKHNESCRGTVQQVGTVESRVIDQVIKLSQ